MTTVGEKYPELFNLFSSSVGNRMDMIVYYSLTTDVFDLDITDERAKRLDLDNIAQLIDWRIVQRKKLERKVVKLLSSSTRSTTMQTQITIELRADFADADKVKEILIIAQACARHLLTNAQLLMDKTKPECVMIVDDYFSPAKQVGLFDDLIAKGKQQMADLAKTLPSVKGAVVTAKGNETPPGPQLEEDGISMEMLKAFIDDK